MKLQSSRTLFSLLLVFILMLSLTGCGGGGGANVSDTTVGSFLSAQRGTKDVLGPPINSFLRTQPGGSPSYAFPYDYFQRDLNGTSTEQEARKTSARDASAWENCYGGTSEDEAYSIRKTADGGFLVAGFTDSNDYDISGLHESADAMLLKLNSNGAKEWVRCLGGTGNDCIYSAQETRNSSGGVDGYIIAGMTRSTDGDVAFANDPGRQCAWVAKLKLDRSVDWQYCFPGNSTACFYSIQQTTDGGYILGGTLDGSMYIVRLEQTGNQVWSKTLGYSIQDCATSVQQTRDGGFIVAGITASNDMPNYHGLSDAWVGKYDASGNEEWAKCIGGSRADEAYGIQQTKDGGYIFTGHTRSNNGDVTGNPSISDCCWVVKLGSGTDPVILWQSCQSGGGVYATGRAIRQTPDGGYAVVGSVDTLHSLSQIKAFKLDAAGQNILWSSILGGGAQDYGYALCGSSDGDTVVAGYTMSSSTTNYHGFGDAFIAKIGEPEPLSIENAQAIPAKFVPSSETTNITADIVAIEGFTPTNLSWGITIADSNKMQVASFAGTGARVSATWNGINAQTSQPYPPGAYAFTINATCSEGKKATATGTVVIVEKRLKITQVTVSPQPLPLNQTATISVTVETVPNSNLSPVDVIVTADVKNSVTGHLSYVAFEPIHCASPGTGEAQWTYVDAITDPPGSWENVHLVAMADDFEPDEKDTQFSLQGDQQSITIENLNIKYPDGKQDFKPSFEDVRVTADIVPHPSSWFPIDLYWEVEIFDIRNKKVAFNYGHDSKPFITWNGKDKNTGDFVSGDADYPFPDDYQIYRSPYTLIQYRGDYAFKITATCKNDVAQQLKAEIKDIATVDNRPLNVKPYSQTNPLWSGEPYAFFPAGNSEKTIGKLGCALTSAYMVHAFYNGQSGAWTIPDAISLMNEALKGNFFDRGYTNDGSVKWDKIYNLIKRSDSLKNYFSTPVKWKKSGPYDSSVVNSEIEANHPVIVFIQHPDPDNRATAGHFVVAKGTKGDKHIINDPGYQKYYYADYQPTNSGVKRDFQVLYLEDFLKFGGTAKKLDWMILYEPATAQSPKSLSIVGTDETGASVEYAIIDPQGRYLGYNPINGIRIEKARIIEGGIPNAQYFQKPWGSLEGDELVGLAKNIWILEPIEGTYTLKVFGIDASERYWLSIGSDDPDEYDVETSGFVEPGNIIEYSIDFSQTPGVTPIVTLIETITAKLDLDPDTLNLKSNGNYVTAYIELPAGYNAANIDIGTVKLEGQIPALSNPTEIGDHNGNGISDLMVKFDRQTLINHLESKGLTSGTITLRVTGKVNNVSFQSTDTMKVKNK